ncbi:MAG: cytochrome P450 [Solirubrobacterales bacterium]|nr:cytochrome P450 [Solirubrobacterales bacterium]
MSVIPHARPSALDRWVKPSRIYSWTANAPERYWLGLPLMPRVLLTCSPADARAIFTERDGALQFGQGLKRLAPHEPMFGADALSRLDGDEHTELRRQLTGAFHGEALKGYESKIRSVSERHMADWPLNRPVRAGELVGELVRDVITSVIFGIEDQARIQRLTRALDGLEKTVNSAEMAARMALAVLLRGRWAPYPDAQRGLAEIEAVTREEIAERRARNAPRDDTCLSRFLYDAEGMPDDDIVTAMRVLVVAGWATSANTIAWLIERLARNPEALARCQEDVAAGQSRYIMATIQETLRIRPPVPFTPRYVAKDVELDGLSVKAGTLIAVDIERMHQRPDIYPEPERFLPGRFLENRPGTYTWLPFGSGHHRCIGAGFALTEARLILTELLKRMTLAPESDPGEPPRRTVLITAPGRGATVTFRS